jgi:hypothetical protein
MKYLLALCLFIISCGGILKNPYTDRNLRADVVKLEQLLGITIDYDVKINNSLNKKGAWGMCYYWTFPTYHNPYIEIDYNSINKGGGSVLLVLLHEIGHCTYQYDHQPIEYMEENTNCVKYIMSQGGKSPECEEYLPIYIKQLTDNQPEHQMLRGVLWLEEYE